MKILEQYAGSLTNFEVLDLLRSRGAGRDPTRVIASVSPSEFKVFDYLDQSAAKNQTRAIVHTFVDECKKFDLSKAEILNVVNLRPSTVVGVFTINEEFDKRMGDGKVDELVETIDQVLPLPPEAKSKDEGGDAELTASESQEDAAHHEPTQTAQ